MKKEFFLQPAETLNDWFMSMKGNDAFNSFALPSKQTTASAYPILLRSNVLGILEFRSEANSVKDWDEVGSLKIQRLNISDYENTDFEDLQIFQFPEKLKIHAISKLIYEDSDVKTECGVIFRDEGNGHITICAGAATCSVTLSTSFFQLPFAPEFSLNKLTAHNI